MSIDRPSLAALLAQSQKAKASGEDVKESTRPFVLKDPKSIVKELLSKSAPDAEPVDDDETYIQSLMKSEDEPTDEFSFELPPEEEETPESILKKIMGGR